MRYMAAFLVISLLGCIAVSHEAAEILFEATGQAPGDWDVLIGTLAFLLTGIAGFIAAKVVVNDPAYAPIPLIVLVILAMSVMKSENSDLILSVLGSGLPIYLIGALVGHIDGRLSRPRQESTTSEPAASPQAINDPDT